jgi:hypothetical protein
LGEESEEVSSPSSDPDPSSAEAFSFSASRRSHAISLPSSVWGKVVVVVVVVVDDDDTDALAAESENGSRLPGGP